jgi:predicted PurR-regulated permease PerM
MTTPFIYGLVVAYILNRPYVFFHEKVFLKMSFLKRKLPLGFSKSLSILTCYVILISFIVFIFAIVVPQLIESFTKFADHLSYILSDGESVVFHGLKFLGLNPSMEKNTIDILTKFAGDLEQLSARMIMSFYDIITKFMVEIYYWTMGMVLSIYILFGKEKLIFQLKKIKDAFLPSKFSSPLMEILRLSHKKVGKFLVGKTINSFLIGLLCFVGVNILGTPYPILVSVVVGITNIIPFFGPFFGAIPSILIVLTVSPVQAFHLAIFLFVLQQIDGNLIGPRILGSATGVSGLWIMFSVILGGGLFGIFGMILGVPVFSVIQVMLGRYVNKRLYGKSNFYKESRHSDLNSFKTKF